MVFWVVVCLIRYLREKEKGDKMKGTKIKKIIGTWYLWPILLCIISLIIFGGIWMSKKVKTNETWTGTNEVRYDILIGADDWNGKRLSSEDGFPYGGIRYNSFIDNYPKSFSLWDYIRKHGKKPPKAGEGYLELKIHYIKFNYYVGSGWSPHPRIEVLDYQISRPSPSPETHLVYYGPNQFVSAFFDKFKTNVILDGSGNIKWEKRSPYARHMYLWDVTVSGDAGEVGRILHIGPLLPNYWEFIVYYPDKPMELRSIMVATAKDQ